MRVHKMLLTQLSRSRTVLRSLIRAGDGAERVRSFKPISFRARWSYLGITGQSAIPDRHDSGHVDPERRKVRPRHGCIILRLTEGMPRPIEQI